jgi:uncharacterized membrane protein YsdA (DUF1294 family)
MGALTGRHVFRHKTRKQPFSRVLCLIVAGQAVAIITGLIMIAG